MNKHKYWILGSINTDFVVDVERFPLPGETVNGSRFHTFYGGKGGNQAAALARLGCSPVMIGSVGDDRLGEEYLKSLEAKGADVTRSVVRKGTTTGTAFIEVDTTGENRIVVVRGANDMLTPEDAEKGLAGISKGDFLLLQLEVPIETVLRAAEIGKQNGAVIILDPAPAPKADKAPLLFKNIDWITPNEFEAGVLLDEQTAGPGGFDQLAWKLVSKGVSNVAIKAGQAGAVYFSETLPGPVSVPPFFVKAVDTTGAGDTFNAGLAWALGNGLTGADAVRAANGAAALSVTNMGAQTSMPTEAALIRFLEGN